MADDAPMRGVLISIKPEFAARIASGEKRVEFRRRASSELAGMWGLVYESQPTCAIVMRVRFGVVVRATPRALWAQYRASAGIDRARYQAYMDGSAHAWALEIDSAETLQTPRGLALDLAWLRARGVTPPMSYAWIARDATWARGLLPVAKARRAA